MTRCDVAIVFPPVTEARLFPYLSLPMLTAYLRQRGISVTQRDLNIELCHRVFESSVLREYADRFDNSPSNLLADRYRAATLSYLLARLRELEASVFGKAGSSNSGIQHDVRFVRQGIDAILEISPISQKFHTFDQIISYVYSFPDICDDTPVKILKKLLRSTLESRSRLLAISIPFFSQFVSALLLARWAKQIIPDITVVVGGQQIMLWGAELTAKPILKLWVDALCTGPGEEWLYQFIQSLKRRDDRSISDLVSTSSKSDRHPQKSPSLLNKLPPPDFSDLPIRSYLSEESHLAIVTCVGCYWGRCAFCSYGNRSLRDGYQQGSPEWIAKTCAQIVDLYGIERINFVDENTHLKVLIRAMRLLNAWGYNITFSTRNRLESILLDKAFCAELAHLGCVLMSVGYETNSQRLLDKMNKGVTAHNYQSIIDNLDEAGISLRFSILGGILDETREEFLDSLAFLKRNEGKIGIDVMQMLVMEPTTLMASDPKFYGLSVRHGGDLRGNSVLNFGMGRMGTRFEYSDGDTFQDRLEQFLEMFRLVAPQKNDELMPTRRLNLRKVEPQTDIAAVTLQPWVKLLKARRSAEESQSTFLVDMLWQRFFQLSNDEWDEGLTVIKSPPNDLSTQSFVKELTNLGMVAVVQERVP